MTQAKAPTQARTTKTSRPIKTTKTSRPTKTTRTITTATVPAPAAANSVKDRVLSAVGSTQDQVLSAMDSTQDRVIEFLRTDAVRLEELAARGPKLPGSERFPQPTEVIDFIVGVVESAFALSRRLVPAAIDGKAAN